MINDKKNFTLIELLVVIAILGILVTLLVPSLANARYKAYLTVCKSNQSQMAKGALIYSQNNGSRWPQRTILRHTFTAPAMLMNDYGKNDDRPILAPYMNLDNSCPFLTSYKTTYDPYGGYLHYSPYRFYFGMPLNLRESKMTFITQILVQNNKEYDILIADRDLIYSDRGIQNAHPDRNPNLMKDQNYIFSNWGNGNYQRGRVDMNFTRTDGSTYGLNGLTVSDKRLNKVSYKVRSYSVKSRWSTLPVKD